MGQRAQQAGGQHLPAEPGRLGCSQLGNRSPWLGAGRFKLLRCSHGLCSQYVSLMHILRCMSSTWNAMCVPHCAHSVQYPSTLAKRDSGVTVNAEQ